MQAGIQNADGTATIQYAYPYPEWKLPSALLPAFMNTWSGGPTNFGAAGGDQRAQLLVHMHLCVAPFQTGATLAQVSEAMAAWPYPVWVKFGANLRLGGAVPEIIDAVIGSYEPEQFMLSETIGYFSLRFDLTVRLHMQFPITA